MIRDSIIELISGKPIGFKLKCIPVTKLLNAREDTVYKAFETLVDECYLDKITSGRSVEYVKRGREFMDLFLLRPAVGKFNESMSRRI